MLFAPTSMAAPMSAPWLGCGLDRGGRRAWRRRRSARAPVSAPARSRASAPRFGLGRVPAGSTRLGSPVWRPRRRLGFRLGVCCRLGFRRWFGFRLRLGFCCRFGFGLGLLGSGFGLGCRFGLRLGFGRRLGLRLAGSGSGSGSGSGLCVRFGLGLGLSSAIAAPAPARARRGERLRPGATSPARPRARRPASALSSGGGGAASVGRRLVRRSAMPPAPASLDEACGLREGARRSARLVGVLLRLRGLIRPRRRFRLRAIGGRPCSGPRCATPSRPCRSAFAAFRACFAAVASAFLPPWPRPCRRLRARFALSCPPAAFVFAAFASALAARFAAFRSRFPGFGRRLPFGSAGVDPRRAPTVPGVAVVCH